MTWQMVEKKIQAPEFWGGGEALYWNGSCDKDQLFDVTNITLHKASLNKVPNMQDGSFLRLWLETSPAYLIIASML